MESNGYTWMELARRAYSLIDEQFTGINANTGFFNDIDIVMALEFAERILFPRFKRRSNVDFIRMRSGITFPGNTPDGVQLEVLLNDGVGQLVSVGFRSTATGTYGRLLRATPAQMYGLEPTVSTGNIGTPSHYMWLDKQFCLLPLPAGDVTLRLVYVAEPRRIMNSTTTEQGANQGGFADAGSYPAMPPQWQHLLALRAAIILAGKRKDARQEGLRADYKEAMEAAMLDASSRDVTEDPSGPNNTYDRPSAAESDYADQDF